MRKREMRGDDGNHYEKPGLKGILCVRQFTIPNTAGTSPHKAFNNTNTKYYPPDQASRTPDGSYVLVSSTSF